MLETRALHDRGVALVRGIVADGERPGFVERVTGEVVLNVDAAACGWARAVEPSAVGLVVDAEDDDEGVEGPRRVVVRTEQARVARLLEDVRVEDAEVIITEHADDVGHERAAHARDVDPGRHVLGAARGAIVHHETVLRVELAYRRGSANERPVVAEKVRRLLLLEEVVVVVVLLAGDLRHGLLEVARGDKNT